MTSMLPPATASHPNRVSRQLLRRVALLGLISILLFAAALVLVLVQAQRQLTDQLEAAGQESATVFDELIGDLKKDLKATGDSVLASADNPQALRQIFLRSLERQPTLYRITLFSARREVILERQRVSQRTTTELPSLLELAKAQEGTLEVGEVSFEEVEGMRVPFVSISLPLRRQGEEPRLFLSARLDLSSLWSTVTEREVGQGGYVLITDSSSRLLVSSDLRQLGEEISSSLGGRSAQSSASPGFEIYRGLSHRWVVASSVPLQEVPWFSVVEIPATAALQPLAIRSVILLVVLCLLLSLVYSIFSFTRRRIVWPLLELRGGVERIRAGELDHRLQLASTDEFGELAESFNQMTEDLQKHLGQLRGQLEELQTAEGALLEARNSLEKRVQERTAELEAANDEMRSLVYLVSHDLRAPLINLRGFASEVRTSLVELRLPLQESLEAMESDQRILVERSLDQDIPESLEFIDSAVSRMDRFTTALLELSRAGHRELLVERLDMAEVVHGILQSLAYQIDQKKIRVKVEDLPFLLADRLAMEQVAGNLLTNAVTYLNPKRKTIIEIRGERGSEGTTFWFRDNGQGISAEDLPKVFDPFRRMGRADQPGEGMGLTYAQALVRRHGGKIWCQSTLGRGSVFAFTIPHLEEAEHVA